MRSLNLPPHLTYVAVLPCEIQILNNHYNLNKTICKNVYCEAIFVIFLSELKLWYILDKLLVYMN